MSITEQARQEPVSPEEVKQKAQEKGQELKSQAGERVREQVDTRAKQAGEQAQSLSQTLRRTSSELRTQGQQSQATVIDQVAIRAEQLAGYLTQADADTLLNDVKSYGSRLKDFARQQPLVVAGAGLALGLVGSRVVKSGGGSQSEQ